MANHHNGVDINAGIEQITQCLSFNYITNGLLRYINDVFTQAKEQIIVCVFFSPILIISNCKNHNLDVLQNTMTGKFLMKFFVLILMVCAFAFIKISTNKKKVIEFMLSSMHFLAL